MAESRSEPSARAEPGPSVIARSRDSSFHSEQAPHFRRLPRPDKSGLAMTANGRGSQRQILRPEEIGALE